MFKDSIITWVLATLFVVGAFTALTHAALDMALAETRCCNIPARDANGKILRRDDVLRAFEKAHPCPQPVGTSCPGWRRDHVIPLSCGGADRVDNLQWLPVEMWQIKSTWERKIYGGKGMSPGCP